MLSKLLVILLFSFANLQSEKTSANSTIEYYCAPELEDAFSLLRKMPQVNTLIDKIQEDGPIHIELNHHISKKFEGYWSPDDRTIYITPNHSKASNITTILFEMHNALNVQTLDYYDSLAYNQQISRNKYIRAVEYWEYTNAKATADILNEGIKMGTLPQECHWHVFNNFEDHFDLQKSTGHSAFIGKMYDHLS